jgi:transposase-like protein/transposase Tn5 family protein/DDE family transposase
MNAMIWAHEQFWGAKLGDIRLQRRLVEVAACIRKNPRGTLPRAVGDSMALKGAYRLLSNPSVTHERILQPHVAATRERCRAPGDYLIIEDTTALSFTQRGTVQGMGPLTKKSSQGFLAHTSLAARIAHWREQNEPEVTLEGVFGQQC